MKLRKSLELILKFNISTLEHPTKLENLKEMDEFLGTYDSTKIKPG